MKISLITVNLNNRLGLERTRQSVMEQRLTGHALEWIVVDGNSTDGSRGCIAPGEARLIQAPPAGVYAALNTGMARAGGDVIGILHSGDVFENDSVLQTVADAMQGDTCDFLFANVRIGKRLYSAGGYVPAKELPQGFAPPHPSLYVTPRVLACCGVYDTSFKVAGDFEYFIRLFKKTSLTWRYLDMTLVRMEPGGRSARLKSRLLTNNRERLRAMRKHGMRASAIMILKHYRRTLTSFFRHK